MMRSIIRPRRGVAHLVLPDEVQDVPSDAPPVSPVGRRREGPNAPAGAVVDDAIGWISAARRPVFIAGEGARHAATELRTLAEQLAAPVLTTFRAKGLVPDTHPLGAGVLGRSGTPVASLLMNEADLLVVVGASFANHTGIAPYKPIVQIDDTASAIGRFNKVDVGVRLGAFAGCVAVLIHSFFDFPLRTHANAYIFLFLAVVALTNIEFCEAQQKRQRHA